MVDGKALTSMPLRAAIIGLGNVAWKYDAAMEGRALTHRSTYASDARTQLVAGFDADPAQRGAFAAATGIATSPTLDGLLEQRPDIVSICSPNGLHAQHLRACLHAGIPMIWLEKPATTDIGEARELIALQRELGTSTVLVGFQRRYQPAYQRLRALITDGVLGECLGMSLTYSRGLETNGVHLVDLLFQLLGDETACDLHGVTPAAGPTASPSFLLQFAGAIPCAVTGLTLDYHSIDMTAHFAAGRASVLHGGAAEIRETRIENPLYPGFFRLTSDPTLTASAKALEQEAQSVFPTMLDDLIVAHMAGHEPASSLRTAVMAQAVVEQVLAAAGQA